MDDQSWAGRALRRGTKWDSEKGCMRWSKEWETQDEELDEKADVRTFRELRRMGNSISRDIRMKEDVPGNHTSGMLPIQTLK